MSLVTAIEIALANGIDPKRYRQALRDANLSWYRWGAPWTAVEGSSEHADLLRVMDGLGSRRIISTSAVTNKGASSRLRTDSDEQYVIDLCDAVLLLFAIRQHRFSFLLGDADRLGRQRALPVDAWYPSIKTVVEYRERQHSESISFFDRRMTVSGMGRGEQRQVYDERRRAILPRHGILLVEFDYSEFENRNGRLLRNGNDRAVVARKFTKLLR